MFYLAVVLEKGQIVDRSLDPEDEAELIVQLDRDRPHDMFDPRPFDADIETVPHLALVLGGELAAEEGGDVIRLHRVNRGARQILVNGLQVGLLAEHDIGGVFALIHAPVVSGGEVPIDRTTEPGQFIQPRVHAFRFPTVGDALCPCPVPDMGEGVIGHSILDAQPAQLVRQPVMPVTADLQPAGQPGRHPHMAQAELLVHEIELVMQTLAVIGKQIRLSGLFVVPRLVGGAGLHRREDAHQPHLLPSFRQRLLHPIFLAEVPLADKLDLDASLRRHLFGVLPNPVPERLGELRVIEDANLPLKQERCHSPGKADPRQGPENQHPVPATQHAGNLRRVPLR